MKEEELADKYVRSLSWLRELFLPMDEIGKPVMGILDWDDSVCIKFGGKLLLASTDGPYTKRLTMKSALIHAATDVLVKGGRPLFALDTLIGKKEDIEDMAESLKTQALAMRIPILGGNTLFEDEAEPRCNITVIGELLLDEPIRDCGAEKDDAILLLGEPIWGEQEERIEKAKKLMSTWIKIIAKVRIHAAKDVTKGGLVSTLHEVSEKSGRKFRLKEEIPYPMTRNLDNFLIFVSKDGFKQVSEICEKECCPIHLLGSVE
jgi:selenophosphate synthetase-related protein